MGLWTQGLTRGLGPHLVWETTVAFRVLGNECQLRASDPRRRGVFPPPQCTVTLVNDHISPGEDWEGDVWYVWHWVLP